MSRRAPSSRSTASMRVVTPAFGTRMSSESSDSRSRSTAARSRTSQTRPVIRDPCLRAASSSSTRSRERPTTTTLAPASSSAFAIARPMPLVPPVISAVLPSSGTVQVTSRPPVPERLQQVPGEQVELAQVSRHGMQEQVLDAGLQPGLDALLDLVDGPGEVDRLDVLPGSLVGDDPQHPLLLLGDRILPPRFLAQPEEVLVGHDEAPGGAGGALARELAVDVRQVEGDLVGR